MSQHESFTPWLKYRRSQAWWLWAGVALVVLAVIGSMTSPMAIGEAAKHSRVVGAGKTIIEGGTGGSSPLPVTTWWLSTPTPRVAILNAWRSCYR